MATGPFEAWFHGSPIVIVQGETGGFGYWFHGSPVVTPGLGTEAVRRDLDMRARISHMDTGSLTARAHIKPWMTMRARISRRQGGPIPPFPIDGFVDTHLDMRFRIASRVKSTTSLESRARIGAYQPTRSFTARAKLSTGQSIGIKANILRYDKSVSYDATFSIARTVTRSVLGVFRIPGNLRYQNLSCRALILGNFRVNATGHYLIAAQIPTGSVVDLRFGSTQGSVQVLRAKARIVQP